MCQIWKLFENSYVSSKWNSGTPQVNVNGCTFLINIWPVECSSSLEKQKLSKLVINFPFDFQMHSITLTKRKKNRFYTRTWYTRLGIKLPQKVSQISITYVTKLTARKRDFVIYTFHIYSCIPFMVIYLTSTSLLQASYLKGFLQVTGYWSLLQPIIHLKLTSLTLKCILCTQKLCCK